MQLSGTELALLAAAASILIAENKTTEEITLLSALFSQIGDTLETIAVRDAVALTEADTVST
jgi:hypothetical protein